MKFNKEYLKSGKFKRDLIILGVLVVLWVATGGYKIFS